MRSQFESNSVVVDKIALQTLMTTTGDWWDKEYERDIHNYLRCKEKKRYFFRGQSHLLHLRRHLVEWINAVCEKMEFCTPVQHLAVYLLDIFMDNHNIRSEHIQLIALGCLIVAVKLEENESIRPKNSHFNALIGNKYTLIEFVEMEVTILTFFEWDISYPTAAHFAEYYAIYAVHPTDSHDNGPLPGIEYVQMYVKKYIDYFLDVIILDHVFLKFNPSLVAASCIACTRKCLLLTPLWPSFLQTITNYKYAELKTCMDLLLRALDADMLSNKESS